MLNLGSVGLGGADTMKSAPQRKSTNTSNSAAGPFFQAKSGHAALDVETVEPRQPTFFRSSQSDGTGESSVIQSNITKAERETPEDNVQRERVEQANVQRTPKNGQSTTATGLQAKHGSAHTPFFQPTHPPVIQAVEQERTEEHNSETLPVQRKPIFESEEDSAPAHQDSIQRQAISNADSITLQSATSKTQPTSETENLEEQGQEEPLEKSPQIQMMLATNMADAQDNGDEDDTEQPPVQFRLKVGQPGDVYEREADAMANRVIELSRTRKAADASTFTSAHPQQVSRKPALLMMQSNGTPPIAADQLETRLQQARGSGSPLDVNTRTEMEDSFSSNFSGVQIHTGQEAASLSQSLGARAFTHGNNIFFNRNEYQPQSERGKHLLAHELTHTIQQGHGVQRKVADSHSFPTKQTESELQKVPDALASQALTSSEVVDLSSGFFSPSDKVKSEIEAQGKKGLGVRTMIKDVTSEGLVNVKVNHSGNYDFIDKGSMPMRLRNPWANQLGGLYIHHKVKNNQAIDEYASITAEDGDRNDWLKALKKNSTVLGGLGLKVRNLPTPVNKLENGKLTLGVNELKVEVGGFVDAQFNLLLENTNKPKIDAVANINVKGVAKGVLRLDNSQEKLTGEVGLGIDLKGFSGEAKVKYKEDGNIDVGGKASYNANKLSGEIQFVATDLRTANQFGRDAIAAAGGKEKVKDAPPPAPVPAAKSGSKERALAATGQLGFNLTEWFAGTVNVVVDGRGEITVIGRITPPAEIELFKQQDREPEKITELEARAYYGIPIVGNLNVFANIGLYALAKLGPAKLYQIEVLGTYSTDPNIQRNIQISGSLNISAYAGLRLRAEGGAGIELADHDVRFGIGLNADVGVKAYADARPTIGYRDPGVFYFSGTLEMVAMPMLGLGGDFFIELDSPWWSPAPDKKWIWPLFSKEWPLSDPIGLNAVLKDYELGSGNVPEIEFKKPEFDPSKFMTNMVDNKLPDKSGGKDAGQGTFKEDGSVPKPTIAPKKPEPKKADAKPSKKGTPLQKGKSANPDSKAKNAENSMKILADVAKQTPSLKAKAPFTQADLTKELTRVKGQVSGVDFSVKPKDEMWAITPKAGDKNGKPFELGKDKKLKGQLKDKEVGETQTIPAKEKSHKLWVEVKGDRATVMIASEPTPLERFLDRKDVKELSDPSNHVGEAKRLLQETNVDVTAVLNASAGDKLSVAEQKDEEAERDLRALVTHLRWIFEQLGEYKPEHPKVGTYARLAGTVADYTPHHIPPKGLANWIYRQVKTIPEDILRLTEMKTIKQAALKAKGEHDGGGQKLSCILIHHKTHIGKEDNENFEYRAHHGKKTAELVAERMRAKGIKPILKGGEPLTDPSDLAAYKADLEEGGEDLTTVGQPSTQFYQRELDAARDAVKVEQKEHVEAFLKTVQGVFGSAHYQSRAAVKAALNNSVGKDGPPQKQQEAMTNLETEARQTWTSIDPQIDKLTHF